ncbi:MAG: cytochrome c [Proteobacteria bacterium]|nr:cytochrome c [Pseudomonadota bacterium]MDA1299439.1 cytochrome c [Pseudomonadota bacterium]
MKVLTAVLMSLVIVPIAFAENEAEYKYREGVMKSIGGEASSIGAIMRGQVHLENLPVHAKNLAALAKLVPGIFPAGSGGGKSEALPSIWEKPEEFKAALNEFIDATAAFESAVNSGEGVGMAFRSVGQACKGCHDDFREEH